MSRFINSDWRYLHRSNKMTAKKKCCGNCMCYMTDVDTDGNLSDFHHDRKKESGFCAIRELFYIVQNDSKPCKNWVHDGEAENEG